MLSPVESGMVGWMLAASSNQVIFYDWFFCNCVLFKPCLLFVLVCSLLVIRCHRVGNLLLHTTMYVASGCVDERLCS